MPEGPEPRGRLGRPRSPTDRRMAPPPVTSRQANGGRRNRHEPNASAEPTSGAAPNPCPFKLISARADPLNEYNRRGSRAPDYADDRLAFFSVDFEQTTQPGKPLIAREPRRQSFAETKLLFWHHHRHLAGPGPMRSRRIDPVDPGTLHRPGSLTSMQSVSATANNCRGESCVSYSRCSATTTCTAICRSSAKRPADAPDARVQFDGLVEERWCRARSPPPTRQLGRVTARRNSTRVSTTVGVSPCIRSRRVVASGCASSKNTKHGRMQLLLERGRARRSTGPR